jgi:hypothetical protein
MRSIICKHDIRKVPHKYYNNIKCRNATSQHHHHMAESIAAFIAENFVTELAEDMPKLALRFTVSERSLAHLATIAFGIYVVIMNHTILARHLKGVMEYVPNLLTQHSYPFAINFKMHICDQFK